MEGKNNSQGTFFAFIDHRLAPPFDQPNVALEERPRLPAGATRWGKLFQSRNALVNKASGIVVETDF